MEGKVSSLQQLPPVVVPPLPTAVGGGGTIGKSNKANANHLLFKGHHHQQSPLPPLQLPLQQQQPCAKMQDSSSSSKKAEAFCIRWKGFQGNIIDSLVGVRGDEEFVDVTLTCDGGPAGSAVQAHKLVLASCSNYFRRILRDTPCQHPVIILNDMDQPVLEALLTYMYRGEVFVSENRDAIHQFLRIILYSDS
jgi:hypothetical protein